MSKEECFPLFCKVIWMKCTRRKPYPKDTEVTEFKRCLGPISLSLLLIGNIVGAGVYIFTGEAAKKYAGPSIIISLLIAAFVQMIAALCYAEFASRLPKTGSSYVYVYYGLGEFFGFVAGWNMLVEFTSGLAAISKGFSEYLDSMTNRTIEKFLTAHTPIHPQVNFISKYPDFIALGICLLFVLILSTGPKMSFGFNNFATVMNVGTLIVIIVLGFIYGNLDTFNSTPFFPNGFAGTIKAVSACIFAFGGCETLAFASEEAQKPQKTIPIIMVCCLLFIALLYVLSSMSLLMMVPYYAIDSQTPFPAAFHKYGVEWARYVVTIGAIFAILTSIFGYLYSLSRLLYSISCDGLLIQAFREVNPRVQTPLVSLIFGGTVAGFVGLLFVREQLIHWLSIGTILTNALVATAVLSLRYEEEKSIDDEAEKNSIFVPVAGTLKYKFYFLSPFFGAYTPGYVVKVLLLIFHAASLGVNIPIHEIMTNPNCNKIAAYFFIALFTLVLLITTFIIYAHRQSEVKLIFKTPLIPILPLFLIFASYFILCSIALDSWLRFMILLLLMLVIYFSYGMWNSNLNNSSYSESTLLTKSPREEEKRITEQRATPAD